MLRLLMKLSATLLAACAALPAQVVLPQSTLQPVERCLRELARAGREQDVMELRSILEQLGMTERRLKSIDRSTTAALERKRKSKVDLVRVSRDLARAGQRLEKHVATMSEEDGRQLAKLALRIDSDLEWARTRLGHSRKGGRWWSDEAAAMLDRSVQLQDVVRRARTVDVPVEVSEVEHPLIRAVCGSSAVSARCGKAELVTTLSAVVAERTMRQAMRASAVERWLRTGEFRIADDANSFLVHFDAQSHYSAALDHLVASGSLARGRAEEMRRHSLAWSGEELIGWTPVEAYAHVTMFGVLVDHAHGMFHSPVREGIRNWVCLSVLGARVAPSEYTPDPDQPSAAGATVAGAVASEERLQMRRVGDAGLVGCRSYMKWLVGRGEDPPWRRSLDINTLIIDGEDLLKCTLMVEFLALRPGFRKFLKEFTLPRSVDPELRTTKAYVRRLEEVVGMTLDDLEARFRAWILEADVSGVSQSLRADVEDVGAEDRSPLLKLLGAIRTSAFGDRPFDVVELTLDRELSLGASAHASYLVRNPSQMEAWPDAHEEYADRDAFTVEGARAGLMSVISPSVGVEEAVAGWMGTFYHRLPLLHPGLMSVGWGASEVAAVLDCGSLVRPANYDYYVAWPFDGMRDVPVSFHPELPNPVPGADQTEFGYPITLQCGVSESPVVNVRLSLYLGAREEANLVECHVTGPSNPANPEHVPPRAWCLIPKERLRSRASYTVVAEMIRADGTQAVVWTFRT